MMMMTVRTKKLKIEHVLALTIENSFNKRCISCTPGSQLISYSRGEQYCKVDHTLPRDVVVMLKTLHRL